MSAAARNPALHARITQLIQEAWEAAEDERTDPAAAAAEAVLNKLLDPSAKKVSAANVGATAREGVVEPTTNDRGDEEHPSWVMLGVSRISVGGAGAVLFDSDLKHSTVMRITLSSATRQRQLNRDYVRADRRLIEVDMSMAQWAAFVSSPGQGDGVPATLRWRSTIGAVPQAPYAPRLALSIDEARSAAEKSVAEIKAAFAAFEERPIKKNRDTLKYAIANAPANMVFAAKSLGEHAENVVTKAKADIEAEVQRVAEQRGLDPGDIGGTLQLSAGAEREPCDACDGTTTGNFCRAHDWHRQS